MLPKPLKDSIIEYLYINKLPTRLVNNDFLLSLFIIYNSLYYC